MNDNIIVNQHNIKDVAKYYGFNDIIDFVNFTHQQFQEITTEELDRWGARRKEPEIKSIIRENIMKEFEIQLLKYRANKLELQLQQLQQRVK